MSDVHTYQVDFDAKVSRKSTIEIIKRRRGMWINAWFRWTAIGTFMTWFLLHTGTYHDRSKDALLLIGMALTISALLSFVYFWEYIRKGNEAFERANQGMRWTCTMDSERWSFENPDGVIIAIPWKQMRITDETPDVWYVSYSGGEMPVWRGPLREAGLEEEFRSRVVDEE
jgi:hypothetical protein